MKEKVVVIGLGYAGLPIALAAAKKYDVVGIDRNADRVKAINAGDPLFTEDESLDENLRFELKLKTFAATTAQDEMVGAKYVLICVNFDATFGEEPDAEPFYELVEKVGLALEKGALVSVETTTPPGMTANKVRKILEGTSRLKCDEDFYLVHSAERVTPGSLWWNLLNVRKIVGGATGVLGKSTEKGLAFYRSILGEEQVNFTFDSTTSELIKVAENAHRDVNIALANQIALYCEELGVEFQHVQRALAEYNKPLLDAGGGVGGYCLPKDSWLLQTGVRWYGRNRRLIPFDLLADARGLNEFMPEHVYFLLVDALRRYAQLEPSGAKVLVLGWAYREDTADFRNTPVRKLKKLLDDAKVENDVHDPLLMRKDVYEMCKGADALVMMTAHKFYYQLDFRRIRRSMRNPIFVDARQFGSRVGFGLKSDDFHYVGVGSVEG